MTIGAERKTILNKIKSEFLVNIVIKKYPNPYNMPLKYMIIPWSNEYFPSTKYANNPKKTADNTIIIAAGSEEEILK